VKALLWRVLFEEFNIPASPIDAMYRITLSQALKSRKTKKGFLPQYDEI
jgi:hypothetical protein